MTTIVLSRRASWWFAGASLVPLLTFGCGGLVLAVLGPLIGEQRYEVYLAWIVLIQVASGFDILAGYWLPRMRQVVLASGSDLERGGAGVLLWPVVVGAAGPWGLLLAGADVDDLWGWPVLVHCLLLPLVLVTALHRLADRAADRHVDVPVEQSVCPDERRRRRRRLRGRRARRRRLRRPR